MADSKDKFQIYILIFYDRIQLVAFKEFQGLIKSNIIQYSYKLTFKYMKKTVGNLIVAVQSRSSVLKRSSKTINTYINKVPCNKQQLAKPDPASSFIQQQMREYPLPPKPKASKRQALLSQKIKISLLANQKRFNQLISKLEQKLTFLQIEQMRELLQGMKQKQVTQNRTGIKKLKYVVNYFLQSSQQIVQIQDHILQSATKLIEQIKQAQKKKVNFLV